FLVWNAARGSLRDRGTHQGLAVFAFFYPGVPGAGTGTQTACARGLAVPVDHTFSAHDLLFHLLAPTLSPSDRAGVAAADCVRACGSEAKSSGCGGLILGRLNKKIK